MTIETPTFGGVLATNDSLNRALIDMQVQITALQSGTGGGASLPLNSVQFNNGGNFGGADWLWLVSAGADDPAFMQGGPDTYGSVGWHGYNVALEIKRNAATEPIVNEVWIETYAGDIASSTTQALGCISGTQSGGTQDVNIIAGIEGNASTSLGMGRTANKVWGGALNGSNFGAGTATEVVAGYFTIGNSGGGTITNAYGVRVSDVPTTGVTNGWAIKTGLGLVELGGNLQLDNTNFIVGTGAGTKIATATGQKLGFWNATPVVQQVLATGAGHTSDDIITFLQLVGLCKQS